MKIDDPKELLKWPGRDRAMVEFSSSADLEKKAAAFRSVLRQWIRYV